MLQTLKSGAPSSPPLPVPLPRSQLPLLMPLLLLSLRPLSSTRLTLLARLTLAHALEKILDGAPVQHLVELFLLNSKPWQ